MQLTGVEFERDGAETTLHLHTPSRTLKVAWALPPAEDRWPRREIALGRAERLRNLGREVKLRS
jgi:hypothetical protein